MKTHLDPRTSTLSVVINGDLVSTTAEQLRPEINKLIEDAAGKPVTWQTFRLDLSAAKMVDSVGLNFIVTLLKSVQKHGSKMQIIYANQNVHRTFLFTRLDKHLELINGAAV
jgi:anti-anti-sigma factor